MKILFVHQNFPGQFKSLAPALAADPSHQVVALTMRKMAPCKWQGVQVLPYTAARETSRTVHPWVAELETKVIRGEACLQAALKLKKAGFVPDVVICHPGWGESLFLKDAWPRARMGMYCEFFYRNEGADVGFDPEFPSAAAYDASRVRVKNVNNLLHFETADAGLAPTEWQASTFPQPFRSRITVAHDGIDTRRIAPNEKVEMRLKTAEGTVSLGRSDEVVTFVARNLEPYRGYHTFMRALPQILAQRPNARVLIVGSNDTSYGAKPPGGKHWRDIFADEVRPRIQPADWSRVHFVGRLAYPDFVQLLQLSIVHVYLTYPFVLSWSLLEAMSAGCAIVASATAPVREAIEHGVSGRLVDFFDPAALAGEIAALLEDKEQRAVLGARARAVAIQRYDLQGVCLPRQLAWVQALAGHDTAGVQATGACAA